VVITNCLDHRLSKPLSGISHLASKPNKGLVANVSLFLKESNFVKLSDYLTKKHTSLSPRTQPHVRITLK